MFNIMKYRVSTELLCFMDLVAVWIRSSCTEISIIDANSRREAEQKEGKETKV